MGGGATKMASPLEQLLITTMMIGRAIAAINCPGMFTIYDFHSSKAPKLKLNNPMANNPFAMLTNGEEDDDEDESFKDPDVYNQFFCVEVGEDKIFIEDVLYSNMSGWLPLHACCMSNVTLDAALKLIDEMLREERRRAADRRTLEGKESSPRDNINFLDLPTVNGPGTFNSRWTPLHMACAYGVEPLVRRLLEEGVNVNTQNSYGYTPLLESCRRGYIEVIKALLMERHLDVNHLPNSDLACESPFSTAPPQRPLGEATRAGFITVVQLLLDDDRIDINAGNSIGWTALHEACFYNRRELITLLLSKGADCTLRTVTSKAMPYHLTNDATCKDIMRELGGSMAVPDETDQIDMLNVLEELASFRNLRNMKQQQMTRSSDSDNGGSSSARLSNMLMGGSGGGGGGGQQRIGYMPMYIIRLGSADDDDDDYKGDDDDDNQYMNPDRPRITGPNITTSAAQGKSQPLLIDNGPIPSSSSSSTQQNHHNSSYLNHNYATPEIPHSKPSRSPGGSSLLGPLPAFNSNSNSNNNHEYIDPETIRPHHEEKNIHSPRHTNNNSSSSISHTPLPLVADMKPKPRNNLNLHAKVSRGGGSASYTSSSGSTAAGTGMPKEFMCELSRKVMTDPVRSIYGNVFERSVIEQWIDIHGKICPLTGAPLCSFDLTDLPQLGEEIRRYLYESAVTRPGVTTAVSHHDEGLQSHTHPSHDRRDRADSGSGSRGNNGSGETEDLYNF